MSETPLAAVILAHAGPEHLARLVGALEDVPVFIHCDASSPAATYTRMGELLPSRVTFVDRVTTSLASWSLVAGELIALRSALQNTSAEHIAVLSGADYPLLSMDELYRVLGVWAGHSWLPNLALPNPGWNTDRHQDGGMWRLNHRFLTRNDNVLFIRDVPLRTPWRRSVPTDIAPRSATQWKVYARQHVERLLAVLDARPDLLRFWRTTLVPDESAIASMMASPTLFGEDRVRVQPANPWYLDWNNNGSGHPRWLDDSDFESIKAAMQAPEVTPDSEFSQEIRSVPCRKLFARKFSSSKSGDVLDRIDAELRGLG